jgi:hypothetical protein
MSQREQKAMSRKEMLDLKFWAHELRVKTLPNPTSLFSAASRAIVLKI